MSIALAQLWQGGSVAPGTSIPITLPTNVSVGNMIVVNIMNIFTSVTDTTFSVADSLGNIYTRTNIGSGDQFSSEIWYSYNILGGACTVTITCANSGFIFVEAAEFSGELITSDPLYMNGASGEARGSSSSAVTDTLDPVIYNGLYVAGNVDNQGATETLTSAGWLLISGDSPTAQADAYIIDAPGPHSASWTLSASSGWFNAIAFFRDSGESSPVGFPFMTTVDAKRI